jgi:GR25 family glycosyltransferase involved in LPS biosynthesis
MLLNKFPVIYINLETRPDRNVRVLNELKKIGVTEPERFKAIKLANGALGCSMSHLKCVELAKQKDYDYVLICEDDIEFLDHELFLLQLNKFLVSDINWDVVLVAGNNMLPYKPINDTCIQIYNCQTTTGYIVKKHYYDTLIKNYKEGIQNLIKNPDNNEYKIDKHWFKLQRSDNWYLIIPLTIVQREDYSDIEKKTTNFKNYMLNYNKTYKPSK